MAMTLFAIGAAGVIGMQRATIQGGEDARRFDMATNIANEWIARLQRDATFWTQPNAQDPDLMNIGQTQWLSLIDTTGAGGTFFTPPLPAAPGAAWACARGTSDSRTDFAAATETPAAVMPFRNARREIECVR